MAVKIETTCDACGAARDFSVRWYRLDRNTYQSIDLCPKCYSLVLDALDKIIANKGRSP